MENLLVSACLLGINCRYDGQNNLVDQLEKLKEKYNLIPICPEIMGGLATPRMSVEQIAGHFLTKDGQNCDREFLGGANEALKIARITNCHKALLQQRSPSCGHGLVYDGSFTNTLVAGTGIAARVLEQAGIQIYSSYEIDELL